MSDRSTTYREMDVFRMVLFLVTAVLSVEASAQLYPVLHDADNQPIGYVVSLESDPLGQKVVHMVSRQGYLASMQYTTSSHYDFKDRVGFRAIGFHQTPDCSDDPVLLPRRNGFDHGIFSQAGDWIDKSIDVHISKREDGVTSGYDYRETLEFNGNVYYVPEDATRVTYYLRGVKYQDDYCATVDRCEESDRDRFSHLLNYPLADPESPPPGGWCDGEDPNIDPQIAVLQVGGFTMGSLELNDANITGFSSQEFQLPVRIKYVDIATILKNGFELPP